MDQWGENLIYKIEDMLESAIPMRNVCSNSEIPPWVLSDIKTKALVKEKKGKYVTMLSNNTEAHKESYMIALNRCRYAYTNKVQNSIKKIMTESHANTPDLFRMVASDARSRKFLD